MNWHGLGSLLFYDCSDDPPEIQISKEPKPRRRPTRETEEEYQQRVVEWEARKPHEPELQGRGNSMIQQYYRDNLLPKICDVVKQFEQQHGRAVLQKDNDFSHGTKPNKKRKVDNVCEAYRKEREVETMKDPAQSPDLNCQESIWNVFMQRVRRRLKPNDSKAQIRKVSLEVWNEIGEDIQLIRSRIREMD